MHFGLTSRQNEPRDLFFVKKKIMAENTEGDIIENLKKGMVDNTEGEVLENLKKVNESLCRVVNMLQGPNSGETSCCQINFINIVASLVWSKHK